MGVFFLINYRLFSLLEREDWPALSYYLEQKVFVKGRYSYRKIQLLATSYMVVTDYVSVLKLESKVQFAKPSAIRKNVLIFGIARILSGNQKDAAEFFKTYLGQGKGREKQWIQWFCGFSQLLCGYFDAAEQEFISLAVSSNDAIITCLSAYFLTSPIANHSLKPDKCREIAKNGCSRVKNVLKNKENWEKELTRMEAEIHITIIKKYIDEAGNWLWNRTE